MWVFGYSKKTKISKLFPVTLACFSSIAEITKGQDKDVKVLYTHRFLARHPKYFGSYGAKFHFDNCFAYFRKVVCVAWWGSGEEGEGRRHSINKQKYECQFLLIQRNIMSLLFCHSSIRNVGGL